MTGALQHKSTGGCILGAFDLTPPPGSSAAFLGQGFFVGHPSSERSQQDCADEHERRERRQKIQIQGTVHEWPPLWFPNEYTLTEARQIRN
jgi:hypothetical protein